MNVQLTLEGPVRGPFEPYQMNSFWFEPEISLQNVFKGHT